MSLATLMNRLHAKRQLKHLTLIAPANGGFEANVMHTTNSSLGPPKTHYSTALNSNPAKALLSALRKHEEHVSPTSSDEDLI